MNPVAAMVRYGASLRQASVMPRLKWHLQRGKQALGRGGLLALGTAVALAAHGVLLQWPEQDELRRQRVTLMAELEACHMPAPMPLAAMDQLRAQLRLALDQRKLAVMEQLGGAGLLLVDIRYRGEDEARGSLRRTSVDVSAVGSYRDLSAALELLAAQPLLRLETLALDRPRMENRLINVKMKLSMLGAPR